MVKSSYRNVTIKFFLWINTKFSREMMFWEKGIGLKAERSGLLISPEKNMKRIQIEIFIMNPDTEIFGKYCS